MTMAYVSFLSITPLKMLLDSPQAPPDLPLPAGLCCSKTLSACVVLSSYHSCTLQTTHQAKLENNT